MFAFKPAAYATILAGSLMLTGCMGATALTDQEMEMKESMDSSAYMPAGRTMRDNIETQELFAQAAFWSREYDLNPSDLEATIKLASSVRKLGNPGRAVEITQTGRALFPRDPYLGAEYGAALIAAERAAEASPVLDEMLRIAPGYARLWSLKGAALDQMENYDLARKHYARALQITPHDPNVLTNIGLSHALAGDAATAEGWLRRAASMPGASPAVQQNLALVLRLQGKTDEAEKYTHNMPAPQRMPTTSPLPQKSVSNYSSHSRANAAPRAASPSSAPQTSYGANYGASRQTMPSGASQSGAMPSRSLQAGQNYSSSADAARDAARRAAQRNTREVISPEQLKAQQDLLAKLSGGHQGPTQQAPTQQGPTQQNSGYPAPQMRGYPQMQATQQPPQSRPAIRRRR